MYIYNYDGVTGAYTGCSQAVADPLESKKQGMFVPIIPDNATTVAPPEFRENEIPVFKNGQWSVIDDFRGQKQINISTREISEVQNPGALSEGFQIIDDAFAQNIQANPDRYDIVNGKLADISETDEYKQLKAKQNETFWNKKFLETSSGWLKINTEAGDILSVLNSMKIIAETKGKLPAGCLTFYSSPDFEEELSENYLQSLQTGNKEMDCEEFKKFFDEVVQCRLERFRGE